jgi:amphi-Trp domain-containing protein
MSDDGAEHDGTEEEGTDREDVELERTTTREEAATLLHDLADGVASGSVAFDDGAVVAAVPESLELEVEYKREDDEAETEVELEWGVDGIEAGDGAADAAEADAVAAGDVDGEDGEPAADGLAVDGLVEPADEARSRAQFELYRDDAGEWRWRLVHHNGNIIADGGEGYNRKETARNGLESVKRNAPGAEVVEQG